MGDAENPEVSMVSMPRAETLRSGHDQTASQSLANQGPAIESPVPVRGGGGRIVKRAALALLLLTGSAAAAYFGYDYWTTGRYMVSTDDAYVQADYTTIAPKVAGYIAEVLVIDNQTVKAGQTLARIDDRDFRAALDQAKADVAAASAGVDNIDAQINLQQASITEAKATLAATEASLSFAQADAARYGSLMQTGAGTIQQAQHSRASLQQFTAERERDIAAVTASERRIAVLTTARGQAAAQVERAQAMQRQAALNLGYTTIIAPIDGVVGARSLRVGQYVTPGTQLMAVVPVQASYIVANYKETQLAHVRAGQPAEIRIDGLPGVGFKAHVDSVSPASGLEFALLPPDNATGNFTKIVQRIPVKLVLDDPAQRSALRAGMSVEPTIDTKAAASLPAFSEKESSAQTRLAQVNAVEPNTVQTNAERANAAQASAEQANPAGTK
jgi:membrane fusion protein, multidrug efflux system